MNDRDRIMSKMGMLVEQIDDYIHWIDMHKGRADPVDEQFSADLQRFINDISKFYRSW